MAGWNLTMESHEGKAGVTLRLSWEERGSQAKRVSSAWGSETFPHRSWKAPHPFLLEANADVIFLNVCF